MKSQIESVLVALVLLAFLGYALISHNQYGLSMATWISLNSLLAVCLRFVLLAGEKNIATAAFLGIGAYASAIATVKLALPFPVSLLLGAACAGVASYLFGMVTLRVKGPYFMLISFSFTDLMEMAYTKIDYVGGNSGIVGIYPPQYLVRWMPAIVVATCSALMLILYLCERSSLGKLFKAIGDNDAIVGSVGISILRIKLICLVLASVAVGFAGALQAHTNNVISPPDFQYVVVVFFLAYIKVGGQSHILGSVVGAALLTLLDQSLLGRGAWEQIIFGLAIVLSMLFLPDGLIGVWKQAVEWLTPSHLGIRASGSGRRLGSQRGASEQ